ncbi:synaptotagmin-like protein 1 isoform X2 [Denticeps clupeoides]|uniref:synaptotagmin-like protein 1 isoform X2 n=1 Tax=Denticeps clupeoides TaxID=299321 RepID=UPI0010A42E14|nr:synaptotagmin-like protein 1 isoform X2 [Denticeps clupeoides]
MDPVVQLTELTDEEVSSILKVLQKDNELQNREKRRISQLTLTVHDPELLHCLSGAWFTDLRDKRHQKGGADLVHTSIRQKKRDRGHQDVSVISVFEKPEEERSEEFTRDTNLSCGQPPRPRPRSRIPLLKNPEKRDNNVATTADGQDRLNEESTAGRAPGSPAPQIGDNNSCTEPELLDFTSTSSQQDSNVCNGSQESVLSMQDPEDVAVDGRIFFSMQHNAQRGELVVCVYRCEDLSASGKSHTNPYVKVHLLPGKSSHSKRKTSVKKKTVNPVYNETLRFRVQDADLRSRAVSLSVWHSDTVRRNHFLGGLVVQLSQWNWEQSEPIWQGLQPRDLVTTGSATNGGTILMAMKFTPPGSEGPDLPLTGELHIWLREVHLPSTKHGAPSTYVKGCVLPDASQSSGQQTRVVKRSTHPVFNHTMVFDGIQACDLTQVCVDISIWDKSTHTSVYLGGVRFSCGTGQSYGQTVAWMDSSLDEQSAWMAIRTNPNKWVEKEQPIRTNLQRIT